MPTRYDWLRGLYKKGRPNNAGKRQTIIHVFAVRVHIDPERGFTMLENVHRHYTVRTTRSYWSRGLYKRGDRTMPENGHRQYTVRTTRSYWSRLLYKRGYRTMLEKVHRQYTVQLTRFFWSAEVNIQYFHLGFGDATIEKTPTRKV